MADPVTEVIPPVTVPDTPKEPVTPPVDDPTKVVPPVPEPKEDPKEDTPEDDKDLDTNVWGTTGDEVGDSVLQLLQNSGVTVDTAKALMWDAVQAGDASKIDKDKLVEAVGKTKANLILSGVENFIAKRTAVLNETLGVLHDEVGGKANWDTMVAWAKENLSADEIDDYIAMVDQGGRKARMAAKDMRERYEEAGNTSLKKDETVIPGKGKQTVATIEPLSRKDYYEELEKARRAGKLTGEASAALWERRQAGQQKGI